MVVVVVEVRMELLAFSVGVCGSVCHCSTGGYFFSVTSTTCLADLQAGDTH